MLRDIFVADTDAEARRAVLDGFAARFWNEYFKPIAEKLNATHMFRRPDADQTAELTAEYLVDTKVWAVGSPATVAGLIREQFELSGGFGTLLDAGQRLCRPGRAGEMVPLDGAVSPPRSCRDSPTCRSAYQSSRPTTIHVAGFPLARAQLRIQCHGSGHARNRTGSGSQQAWISSALATWPKNASMLRSVASCSGWL